MSPSIRPGRAAALAFLALVLFVPRVPSAFAAGPSAAVEFSRPMSFYMNLSLEDVRALFRSAGISPNAAADAPASPATEKARSVCAVLPFANTSGRPEYAWLSAGIMNLFLTELADSPALAVLDRSRIEDCLREIEFSMTDLTDAERELKAGAFLSADLILLGDYQVLGGTILVNARLVETETTAVRYAGNATAALDASLFAAQKDLARALKARMGGSGVSAPAAPEPEREVSLEALREYETAHADYLAGNLSSAVSRLRKLLDRYPRYADARIELTDALRRSGAVAEAKDILRKAIAEERKARDANPGSLARYYYNLAGTEMNIARSVDLKGGRDERTARAGAAEAALREAVRYVDRMPEAERPSVRAAVLQQFAVLEDLRIDFLREPSRPLGRAYLYTSLELSAPLYKYDSEEIQGKLLILGKAYINENRQAEAQSFLGETVRVLKEAERTTGRSYNMALQFLGLSYLRQGDKARARACLSEAYDLKMRLYGPTASDTVRTKQLLDSL